MLNIQIYDKYHNVADLIDCLVSLVQNKKKKKNNQKKKKKKKNKKVRYHT